MLIDELRSLPNSPGIYQYFDKFGKLLYVGKAKSLKNRVKSYFSFTPNLAPAPTLSPRIHKMISETTHLEYILTPSEADALILENSFIKQLKPKYNILLRDDKTYPYIYVDLDEEFPRFDITRKLIKGKNIKYFGPYFKGAKEILEAIYLNFKLIQKRSCIKGKKACLFHQINRCKAPCEGKITRAEYAEILNSAIVALQNPLSMQPSLENLMMRYATSENYEEAAKIRDKIQTIKDLDVKIEVDLAKLDDFEVFAVSLDESFICAVRFSIQNGKIVGVNHNITNAKMLLNDEINEAYKHFILESFGVDQPVISSKIYTNDEFEDSLLVEEILSTRHGRKFSVKSPKLGEKKRICKIAQTNAEIFIKNYKKSHDNEFLNELKEYFDLAHTPLVIEAFDNSHMFGEACVGAMIGFANAEFAKDRYRLMHLEAKNDYDQMRQMLTERALRFDKLNPPDLWVIDGGEVLLNLANEILKSSGANVDVIAISKEKIDAKAHRAKGSAKDKIYTQNGVFSLNTDDRRLLFFQRLRDEAHRFAITFHQKTKKRRDLQSGRLESAGISAGSIAKLIKFYGNFENILNADIDEIAKVANKSVAQKIMALKQDEV